MHQDLVRSIELREKWLPVAKIRVVFYRVVFQLELKNFERARKTLGEILSGMVIDGYPVIAEYIGDKASEIVNNVSKKSRLFHVRSSQRNDTIVTQRNDRSDTACWMSVRLSTNYNGWCEPNVCSAETSFENPIQYIQSSLTAGRFKKNGCVQLEGCILGRSKWCRTIASLIDVLTTMLKATMHQIERMFLKE